MKPRTMWLMAGLGLLFVGLLLKNSVSYKKHSLRWRAAKSGIETLLIWLMLLFMPQLAIAFGVLWATRPFGKDRWLAVTLSVFVSSGLGSISVFAMEVLAIVTIFSIDLLTGAQGFLGHFWRARAVRPVKPVVPKPRISIPVIATVKA